MNRNKVLWLALQALFAVAWPVVLSFWLTG